MSHGVDENESNIKKSTNHGAVFSIIAIFISLFLIIGLSYDLFFSNIILSNGYQKLDNNKFKNDTFSINLIFHGKFSECETGFFINSNGFGDSFDKDCVRVDKGCKCFWICKSCQPYGILQNVNFNLSRLITFIIDYEYSIPFYEFNSYYNLTGRFLNNYF